MLPVIAIVCAIVAIMGLTIYSKTGYESQNSRAQKDPSALKRRDYPQCTSDFVLTFSKVRGFVHNRESENAGCSVQYLETAITFVCTLYAAQNMGVNADLIRYNVSAYVLLCRLLYPLMYGFDLDFFASCAWYFSFQAMLVMASSWLL